MFQLVLNLGSKGRPVGPKMTISSGVFRGQLGKSKIFVLNLLCSKRFLLFQMLLFNQHYFVLYPHLCKSKRSMINICWSDSFKIQKPLTGCMRISTCHKSGLCGQHSEQIRSHHTKGLHTLCQNTVSNDVHFLFGTGCFGKMWVELLV